MISFPFRTLALSCAALVMAGTLSAQTATINKARAFVGTEAALDAVKTIYYAGTLTSTYSDDPAKETKAKIEIIFQKPDRQRIVVTSDKVTETTALDVYEGWQRVEEAANAAKWRQVLLTPDQVRRLRANTWENLSFFRGIETRGGRIDVLESTTTDGVACQKLAFIYAPNIVFFRYFDKETGQLVLTETESGSAIREEGEMKVAGVRFPKKIVTTTKMPTGKIQTVIIEFEAIKVNESFPDDTFKVPELRRK